MGSQPSKQSKDKFQPQSKGNIPSRPLRNLPPGPELNIVLIGKTGHGKSATANSIFGKEIFESKLSSESQTKLCKMEKAVVGGREINLVDTPGTMDTRQPDEALKEICTAVVLRPEGFHAFILVLNVVARFTNEEKMAVLMLKKMFGDDVLTRYTVLVFTHGDSFYNQISKREQSTSFMDYICSQGGELGGLVKECKNRCVLMNNMENDPYIIREQVIQLIEVIDTLVSENNGKMYTNELFEYTKSKLEEEKRKEQEERDSIDNEKQSLAKLKIEFEKIRAEMGINNER